MKYQNYELRDSKEYIDASVNIKLHNILYSGELIKDYDYRLFSKRPPSYPILYMICNSKFIIICLQNILSICSFLLILKLFKKLEISNKYASLLFSTFWIFTYSIFVYSNYIMADSLLMFCTTLIIYLLLLNSHKLKHIITLYIFIIIGVFLKPVFLFLSILFIAILLYLNYKSTTRIYHLFGTLITTILCIAYIISNGKKTGVNQFSSITTINKIHYNTKVLLYNKIGKHKTDSILQECYFIPKSKQDYIKYHKLANHKFNYVLSNHSFSYSIFHLKGMLYFILDPGRFDLYNFFRLEQSENSGFLHKNIFDKIKTEFKNNFTIYLMLLFAFSINVLKLIGILILLISFKNKIDFKILVLLISVFIICILTGPLGSSRLSLSVQPIIILLATKGWLKTPFLKRF